MSTLLARAILVAQRAASRVQGGQIVYRRGSDSAEITAAFGRSEFPVETSGTVRMEHSDRDFLVLAESLILGGQPATPQDGDRLERIEGDKRLVYEAMPIGTERCARLDPSGVLWRIHTKLVKTETT